MAKCVRCGNSGFTLKVNSDGLCPSCQEFIRAEEKKKSEETASRLATLQAFYDRYSKIPDADEYAAKKIAEADAYYAEKTRSAEEQLRMIEHASAIVLAEINEKIAALLSESAHDFHYKALSAADVACKKERKSSSASCEIVLNPLTLSTFKRPAAQKGFVVFDFETTGLSSKRDRIIEIGAIIIDGGIEKGRFNKLVNPGIPIPAEASSINHIYDYMVSNEQKIEQILPDFLQFIGDRPMIAYNASFDIAFFEAALQKSRLAANISYADALQMARKAYPDLENYKLGTVTKHLRIKINDQHRAIGDCEALGAVVLDILAKQ